MPSKPTPTNTTAILDMEPSNSPALPDLTLAHGHCSRHRETVLSSSACGCFYCLGTFAPAAITEWIDRRNRSGVESAEGNTALCPECGIDAVIGDRSGLPLTPMFLAALHDRWFSFAAPAPTAADRSAASN